MPVPQGFTITTDACTQYYADGREINEEIEADIFEHVKGLEKITGKDLRRHRQPAAGVRALRRAPVHARHDGHHPEPGPERRGR
jgi:phosphoenolpyruvate synthase/pyruvate phosphate dikinase